MSKFMKVMITLLVIAGFVAPVAMADDRVALSGYYQLRGYATDNADYDDDANDSEQFFYQRLRVQTDIAVAEGVTATFRADLQEGSGDDANDGTADDFDVDQAYVTIDQPAYTLTLGTYGVEFGNYILLDQTSDTVAQVALKSIPLTLAYSKLSEGLTEDADDQDMYSAIFDAGFAQFFAGYVNTQGSDVERMALGVVGSYDLDAIQLSYEIDYIDGENAVGVDEKGLNFWLNGSFSLSDAATVGAVLTFALGEDDDDQVYELTANDFSPENDGFMATTYGVYPGDTFDPLDMNTGVIGIQPYVDFKISDSLAAHAHVAYVMEEDDTNAEFEITTLAASMRYQYAANTTVDVAASYSDIDSDGLYEDDAATTFACRLNVSF